MITLRSRTAYDNYFDEKDIVFDLGLCETYYIKYVNYDTMNNFMSWANEYYRIIK